MSYEYLGPSMINRLHNIMSEADRITDLGYYNFIFYAFAMILFMVFIYNAGKAIIKYVHLDRKTLDTEDKRKVSSKAGDHIIAAMLAVVPMILILGLYYSNRLEVKEKGSELCLISYSLKEMITSKENYQYTYDTNESFRKDMDNLYEFMNDCITKE